MHRANSDKRMGKSMSIHPHMNAHQGRSSGFENSWTTPNTKEMDIIATRKYLTRKKRGFGNFSPVESNII